MPQRYTFYRVAVILVVLTVVFAAGACRDSGRASSPPAAVSEPVGTTGTTGGSHDVAMNTDLFRRIANRNNPVVVFITTKIRRQEPGASESSGVDSFFRRFFGAPVQPRGPEILQQALGSGFLISADGEILTNNHVIAGAEQIRVGLFEDDRKTYAATVIGRDALTDSALIKLKNAPRTLPYTTLGDSDDLAPGDWVMAIGNPFHLGHTVTVGVVSYKGRPFAVTEGRFQNMLQTDASINPGNSGGPLINVRDEVVGINTAILSGEGGGGNIGIGFAVPINTVKALLPKLRAGKVQRGRLGVQIRNQLITEDEARELRLPKPEGAIVSMVEHDSPAERAGLRAGDVIVEFNGKPVPDADTLTSMVAATPAGTRVPVVFYRNGQREEVTVTVEELVADSDDPRPAGAAAGTTRGFGVALADLTPAVARQLRLPPATGGALVEYVEPFAPASESGLMPGDVILEVNGSRVQSATDAARELGRIKPGQPAFVLVSRRGNQVFLEMRKE